MSARREIDQRRNDEHDRNSRHNPKRNVHERPSTALRTEFILSEVEGCSARLRMTASSMRPRKRGVQLFRPSQDVNFKACSGEKVLEQERNMEVQRRASERWGRMLRAQRVRGYR